MNMQMSVYGLVMLIVFAAAQFTSATVNPAYLWIVLAIIIILLNMWVGKSMKNPPKGLNEIWMHLAVFGFITTVVFGLWMAPTYALPLAWLMSFWLLIKGAAAFVSGMASGNHMHTYAGTVFVFAALFVGAFGAWYFLMGAWFFGLFPLIAGLLTKG